MKESTKETAKELMKFTGTLVLKFGLAGIVIYLFVNLISNPSFWHPSKTPIPAGPVYNAPVINYNPKAALGTIDPKTISPNNPGYVIDLDGDGIPDFVIMHQGNELAWARGLTTGAKLAEIVVLRINGNLTSYRIDTNGTRIGVFFSDDAYRQYFQPCIGVNNGIPYFGNVEEQ